VPLVVRFVVFSITIALANSFPRIAVAVGIKFHTLYNGKEKYIEKRDLLLQMYHYI